MGSGEEIFTQRFPAMGKGTFNETEEEALVTTLPGERGIGSELHDGGIDRWLGVVEAID